MESKLVDVLKGEAQSPPPVWLMRQAGRYLPEYRAERQKAGSFWKMCLTPEVAAQVTLQPVRRFGLDAAIIFSDIMLVPHALGLEVGFEDGIGPQVSPVEDARILDRDIGRWGDRLAPVYESLRIVRAKIGAGALLGFAGAPWTMATYLAEGHGSADQKRARLWMYRDPNGFSELIDAVSECIAFHLVHQLEAGADAVQLFDSWASGLPPDQFARWVIAPTRQIVHKVRAARPRARIIGFPRGATLEGYERYARETGVDAVSLDTAVPVDWAVKSLAPHVALQGNLDPMALLAGGTALDQAVDRILGAAAGVPLIFNLGHGVLPETPPEHVTALVARVRA